MELKRLDHYEPGTKLIALFPVSAYKTTPEGTPSKRATKMSPGEVVTVYSDDRDEDGGFFVRWKGEHYRVYVRYDFAVAPEPNQVAWLMVDHNIAKGQIDRLQARADGLVADLLKSRERVAILEQELVEADNDRRNQQNRADANAQIMKSEQEMLKISFDYLRKMNGLTREVDEIFNLSEQDFPGQTE